MAEVRRLQKRRATEIARIGNDFGDPLLLAHHYVEPDCQNVNPANLEDHAIASVARSPAFESLRAFFARSSKDVLRDGRRHLFVLADAGMGKTSLLVMLKLMHLSAFWPEGYKCGLIRLGRRAEEEMARLEDHAHTVLLLDSLDEDPLAWGRTNERIAEILQASDRFLAVVVTCRTQFFPNDPASPEKPWLVEIAGYRCPSIYLSQFTDAQISTYIRKRFRRTPWQWLRREDHPRHASAMNILSRLDTLAMRPMLLAYIDDLVKLEEGGDSVTGYQAYATMVDEWLAREERRSAGKVKKVDLAGACMRIALHLDATESRTLTPAALAELALTDRTVRNVELIDLGGRSLLNRTSSGEYRFAHYTLQEFLLARSILDRDKERGMEQVSVQGTTLLGRFLVEGARFKKRPNEQFAVHHATFRKAAFEGLDLSGVEFYQCRFENANLRTAIFNGATLSQCVLTGADLSGAKLGEADVASSDLTGTKLAGARADTLTRWPVGFDASVQGVVTASESRPRATAKQDVADWRTKERERILRK